jgi:hypothetical protein
MQMDFSEPSAKQDSPIDVKHESDSNTSVSIVERETWPQQSRKPAKQDLPRQAIERGMHIRFTETQIPS